MGLSAYPNNAIYELLIYLFIKYHQNLDDGVIKKTINANNADEKIKAEVKVIKEKLGVFDDWVTNLPKANHANNVVIDYPEEVNFILNKFIEVRLPTLCELLTFNLPQEERKGLPEVGWLLEKRFYVSEDVASLFNHLKEQQNKVEELYEQHAIKIITFLLNLLQRQQDTYTNNEIFVSVYIAFLFAPNLIVDHLLQFYGNYVSEDTRTYFFNRLVNHQISSDVNFPFIKEPLLHQICLKPFRCFEKIKTLFYYGVDPSLVNVTQWTAAHYLFMDAEDFVHFENQNDIDTYKTLRCRAEARNQEMSSSVSSQFYANFLDLMLSYHNDTGVDFSCYRKGLTSTISKKYGWTIFHLACRYGEPEAVQALLNNASNIIQGMLKKQDSIGLYPLNHLKRHYSSEKREKIVDVLIQEGVVIPSENTKAKFPWGEYGKKEISYVGVSSLAGLSAAGMVFLIFLIMYVFTHMKKPDEEKCADGSKPDYGYFWDPRVSCPSGAPVITVPAPQEEPTKSNINFYNAGISAGAFFAAGFIFTMLGCVKKRLSNINELKEKAVENAYENNDLDIEADQLDEATPLLRIQ